MRTRIEAARRDDPRDRHAERVIQTSEGSAIQVSQVRGPEATRRAISELLGPVFEQRTDLTSARARQR